jgi:hypothetical protein
MRKTGPNDVGHVVWAISTSFFYPSCFYILISDFLDSTYVLKARGGVGQAVTKKTGPNDARHVVWAISMSFLFFFTFFE